GAGGQQRDDGRIVAAMAICTKNAGAVDLGDQLVLAQARLDLVEDSRVHLLDDLRRDAHVADLGGRLDRPLPVDQRSRINEARGGQVALQRAVGGSAEVVVVQLDADGQPVPATSGDDLLGQVVHRVALGGLNVVV